MSRETRHLRLEGCPSELSTAALTGHFTRWGAVERVERSGDVVRVSFMDVRSAGKAQAAEHRLLGLRLPSPVYAQDTAVSPALRLDPPPTSSTGPAPDGGPWSEEWRRRQRFAFSETTLRHFTTRLRGNGGSSRGRSRGEKRRRRREGGAGSGASSSGSPSPSLSSRRSSLSPSSSRTSAAPDDGQARERAQDRPPVLLVKNLPARSSDTSIKDGLFFTAKKCAKVESVKVVGEGEERFALLFFRAGSGLDLVKASADIASESFFGARITAEPAPAALVVQESEGARVSLPEKDKGRSDGQGPSSSRVVDELHPRSSRTLYVGNLDKTTTTELLQKQFTHFGHILDVDIKNRDTPAPYSFIQFADISACVRAIVAHDGGPEALTSEPGRGYKVGFGKTLQCNSVWLGGLPDNLQEHYLIRKMRMYGDVSDCLLDNVLHQAFVTFTSQDAAVDAVKSLKARARQIASAYVQIDYGSTLLNDLFIDRDYRNKAGKDGDVPSASLPAAPTLAPAPQPPLAAPSTSSSRAKHDARREHHGSSSSSRRDGRSGTSSRRSAERERGSSQRSSSRRSSPHRRSTSVSRRSTSRRHNDHSEHSSSSRRRDRDKRSDRDRSERSSREKKSRNRSPSKRKKRSSPTKSGSSSSSSSSSSSESEAGSPSRSRRPRTPPEPPPVASKASSSNGPGRPPKVELPQADLPWPQDNRRLKAPLERQSSLSSGGGWDSEGAGRVPPPPPIPPPVQLTLTLPDSDSASATTSPLIPAPPVAPTIPTPPPKPEPKPQPPAQPAQEAAKGKDKRKETSSRSKTGKSKTKPIPLEAEAEGSVEDPRKGVPSREPEILVPLFWKPRPVAKAEAKGEEDLSTQAGVSRTTPGGSSSSETGMLSPAASEAQAPSTPLPGSDSPTGAASPGRPSLEERIRDLDAKFAAVDRALATAKSNAANPRSVDISKFNVKKRHSGGREDLVAATASPATTPKASSRLYKSDIFDQDLERLKGVGSKEPAPTTPKAAPKPDSTDVLSTILGPDPKAGKEKKWTSPTSGHVRSLPDAPGQRRSGGDPRSKAEGGPGLSISIPPPPTAPSGVMSPPPIHGILKKNQSPPATPVVFPPNLSVPPPPVPFNPAVPPPRVPGPVYEALTPGPSTPSARSGPAFPTATPPVKPPWTPKTPAGPPAFPRQDSVSSIASVTPSTPGTPSTPKPSGASHRPPSFSIGSRPEKPSLFSSSGGSGSSSAAPGGSAGVSAPGAFFPPTASEHRSRTSSGSSSLAQPRKELRNKELDELFKQQSQEEAKRRAEQQAKLPKIKKKPPEPPPSAPKDRTDSKDRDKDRDRDKERDKEREREKEREKERERERDKGREERDKGKSEAELRKEKEERKKKRREEKEKLRLEEERRLKEKEKKKEKKSKDREKEDEKRKQQEANIREMIKAQRRLEAEAAKAKASRKKDKKEKKKEAKKRGSGDESSGDGSEDSDSDSDSDDDSRTKRSFEIELQNILASEEMVGGLSMYDRLKRRRESQPGDSDSRKASDSLSALRQKRDKGKGRRNKALIDDSDEDSDASKDERDSDQDDVDQDDQEPDHASSAESSEPKPKRPKKDKEDREAPAQTPKSPKKLKKKEKLDFSDVFGNVSESSEDDAGRASPKKRPKKRLETTVPAPATESDDSTDQREPEQSRLNKLKKILDEKEKKKKAKAVAKAASEASAVAAATDKATADGASPKKKKKDKEKEKEREKPQAKPPKPSEEEEQRAKEKRKRKEEARENKEAKRAKLSKEAKAAEKSPVKKEPKSREAVKEVLKRSSGDETAEESESAEAAAAANALEEAETEAETVPTPPLQQLKSPGLVPDKELDKPKPTPPTPSTQDVLMDWLPDAPTIKNKHIPPPDPEPEKPPVAPLVSPAKSKSPAAAAPPKVTSPKVASPEHRPSVVVPPGKPPSHVDDVIDDVVRGYIEIDPADLRKSPAKKTKAKPSPTAPVPQPAPVPVMVLPKSEAVEVKLEPKSEPKVSPVPKQEVVEKPSEPPPQLPRGPARPIVPPPPQQQAHHQPQPLHRHQEAKPPVAQPAGPQPAGPPPAGAQGMSQELLQQIQQQQAIAAAAYSAGYGVPAALHAQAAALVQAQQYHQQAQYQHLLGQQPPARLAHPGQGPSPMDPLLLQRHLAAQQHMEEAEKARRQAQAASAAPKTMPLHHAPQPQVPPQGQPQPAPQAQQAKPGAPSGTGSILQRYPARWQGNLALKTDVVPIQMHLISGNAGLIGSALPGKGEGGDMGTVRVSQRMRLEAAQLDGVQRRMELAGEHCVLLALPCGTSAEEILNHSRTLTTGFVHYLQQKQAAGIVNVPVGQTTTFVVHIFPPCPFSDAHLNHLAPEFIRSIQERQTSFLFIVITTVQ